MLKKLICWLWHGDHYYSGSPLRISEYRYMMTCEKCGHQLIANIRNEDSSNAM